MLTLPLDCPNSEWNKSNQYAKITEVRTALIFGYKLHYFFPKNEFRLRLKQLGRPTIPIHQSAASEMRKERGTVVSLRNFLVRLNFTQPLT